EDDEAIRWLIKKVLERKYDVHVFSHVGNAMKQISQYGQPDLVMKDIRLPVIDGKEFLRNFKRSGLYGDIPVVVISSWNDEETKKECLDAGADEYIAKPFNPEILLNTVKSVLKNEKSDSIVG
ncbi:MAG: response regulator, partial [Cyclobacteriaceae bacterium]